MKGMNESTLNVKSTWIRINKENEKMGLVYVEHRMSMNTNA
jgi:hypothetical protein